MIRSAKFWIMMTVFQVVFGLAIFAITRQYYIHTSDNVSAEPTTIGEPSSMAGPHHENQPGTVLVAKI